MVVLCSVWQLIVVRAPLRRTMITPIIAPSNALVSRQLCDSIAIVGSYLAPRTGGSSTLPAHKTGTRLARSAQREAKHS